MGDKRAVAYGQCAHLSVSRLCWESSLLSKLAPLVVRNFSGLMINDLVHGAQVPREEALDASPSPAQRLAES